VTGSAAAPTPKGHGVEDAALIAIDWGTTSARAYAVDARGAILATRTAPLGIQLVPDARFTQALDTLLGDWRERRLPRIAAGMIGSRQGWVEAPYVECPATFESLAAHLVQTPGGELAVIPGLIVRDESGVPDVMRGEETQLAGAIDAAERGVLAVLPGTHSKWAAVDAGRVVDFASSMTGELYAALLGHTILGRLAERADASRPPGNAFDAGVRRGLAAGGLAHRIFAARTLPLTGALPPRDVPDYLSGLLIGDEIAGARDWARRHDLWSARPRVIGADALVERYVHALAIAGIDAERGPPDAAVRGIVRLARLAQRLH
jgi:2-dehydro-3-deoxygalactonokinase